MEDLIEFLKQNENNGDIAICLITTSGLVSGLLQPFDSSHQTILLSNAIYYTGNARLKILYPTIFINQVIGWSIGYPESE